MKTIVWDYNGTILDDVGIAVRIENEMLKKRGLFAGYTVEDYRNLFDIPMENYYRKIGYTFTTESFEDIGVEFYHLYDHYFSECKLNEGIQNKLEEAVRKGYQNVILSSCAHENLVKQCKQLNIDSYFKEIMGVDNYIGGSKVEIGRNWLQKNQIDPDECIYIGDTNADYETAKALNIEKIYLISQGHQSYERLKKLHTHTYQSILEVNL